MDRAKPCSSDSEEKIPEAWIGQEVMLETTEVLSSDLRAATTVLEIFAFAGGAVLAYVASAFPEQDSCEAI